MTVQLTGVAQGKEISQAAEKINQPQIYSYFEEQLWILTQGNIMGNWEQSIDTQAEESCHFIYHFFWQKQFW